VGWVVGWKESTNSETTISVRRTAQSDRNLPLSASPRRALPKVALVVILVPTRRTLWLLFVMRARWSHVTGCVLDRLA
jgi:hypothetical protein